MRAGERKRVGCGEEVGGMCFNIERGSVVRYVSGVACGYRGYTGAMDVAIAIRTGIVKDVVLQAQAGAGGVYDSVPESEWQETETKARALIRAAELVEQGLT